MFFSTTGNVINANDLMRITLKWTRL